MAAEATHVVLTELVFDEFFSQFSKAEFMIGTLFPDIRYLGVIDRAKTHTDAVDLKQVMQERSSFFAGLKFHSLVDHVREDFMVSREIYSYCPASQYITQSLKLLEDERYYPKIDSWAQDSAYLTDYTDEEKDFGIPQVALEKWHVLLKEYFREPPTDALRAMFMAGLGFEKRITDSITVCVNNLREKKEIIKIIDDFIAVFPKLMQNQ
ncbi:MAG: hypothetical protein Q7R83_00190 [bacterium]|nr:hypothetical protein [bacterium]